MTGSGLALLTRTAVHLQPGQVASRARLRAQHAALRRWPAAGRRLLAGPDPAAAAGWPDGFRPADALMAGHWPGRAELRSGRITLLGLTRDLADPADWQHPGVPQLWRFHLHYWDWAWGLAADPDRVGGRAVFAGLWRSWLAASTFGRGDGWLPYPAALRAWSWCGLHRSLVAGTDLEPGFVRELAAHAGYLRRHLESDVGGNHLIKDLKALAGLAVFFADEQLLNHALRRLTAQLAVQVLPDGGHYERAPAYHCQVLADLIDVAGLLRAGGREPAPEITHAIARMRRWLGCVLTPAGQVPLLNDGYPVPGDLLAALRPGPTPGGPMLMLPDTGLVRAAVGGWQLLADVGPPCPAELPAHAHADTFGCLLHVDGAALLADTGTSTYAAGPVRSYERSTAAHSTVEVDGANSTEVWGAFRAARRARVRDLVARSSHDRVVIEAAHDGYRGLRGAPLHRRCWLLTIAGLSVDDVITGHGRHSVVIRWHLAPGVTARPRSGGADIMTPTAALSVNFKAPDGAALAVEQGQLAAGFLRTARAPVLTCRITAALPIRVTTSWRRVRGACRGAGAEGAT